VQLQLRTGCAAMTTRVGVGERLIMCPRTTASTLPYLKMTDARASIKNPGYLSPHRN
jgi:hypothetical protein